MCLPPTILVLTTHYTTTTRIEIDCFENDFTVLVCLPEVLVLTTSLYIQNPTTTPTTTTTTTTATTATTRILVLQVKVLLLG